MLRGPSRTGPDLCTAPPPFRIWRPRVIGGYKFNLLDSAAPAESLHGVTKEAEVGNHFREDVHAGTEEAAKENDEEPIALGAAPEEVHDRQDLQEKSPRRKKVSQLGHGRPSLG